MPVFLHRAERTDLLAEGLAALLARPGTDAFAEEVVVVPAKGVERWLTQRLSHRLGGGPGRDDGVCAGVRFLNPQSLVTLILGTDRSDPWLPHQLVWPLLATIDACLDEPWAATLARHLGHTGETMDETRAGRRFSVAQRLAGLFHSYAVQRPALLAAWSAGLAEDGTGTALDADLRWQPPLWRALLERVDATPPDVRHTRVLARLRLATDDLALPHRISLFGHTRLAETEVELLLALGTRREVHLWLPHPSPGLWDALVAETRDGPVVRTEDHSAAAARHPLLASLGRDVRELQRSLVGVIDAPLTDLPTAITATGFPGPPTWLGHLQADVLANRAPTAADRAARPVADDDMSIQVHACHGPTRQVEVLRDVLAGMLADDPTLEPRDILVMCPDVEAYAPLIAAAFGMQGVTGDPNLAGDGISAAGRSHPAHELRVRLADRAASAVNPLLALATRLLDLAGGRIRAGDVIDLAAGEPVRRRFGFDDNDLAQLSTWIQDSGIRWGLHRDHRASYALGSIATNTWRVGIDRILLGVARAEGPGRFVESVLPLDDVDSGAVDLAGRLAELVDRLDHTRSRLLSAQSAAEWTTALGDGVADLADVPPSEAWQRAELDRELAALRADAGAATVLRLPDVRLMLAQSDVGRAGRANFRTGTLTVCTMVPMRSVPHRVVCLLGLDDGVFPRTHSPDGDDVLARRPRTGERDGRSEDRQLLLDALMAARETLVVTYTGASEITGAHRPPAVPVLELIGAADATATLRPGREVVIRQPLQAFDQRNLLPGGVSGPDVFGFDPAALAGAQAAAARDPRAVLPPFLAGALPSRIEEVVSLERLLAFYADPLKGFLDQRLVIGLPREADDPADGIPIELDNLEQWGIGDRLLRSALAGVPTSDLAQAEYLRGTLPPGRLGSRVLTKVGRSVDAIVDQTARLRTGAPRAVDIGVPLADGRSVMGTVTDVYGDAHVASTYSRLGPKQRLAAWIRLLALSGSGEGRWSAHTVGKAAGGAAVARFGPISSADAIAWLADLVDVYDRGLREPIPLPLKTSHAYATALLRSRTQQDRSARKAGATAWADKFGDRSGAVVERLYGADPGLTGGSTDIERILGVPAPDEFWSPITTTRLGQYALRVWGPMLRHEQGRGR